MKGINQQGQAVYYNVVEKHGKVRYQIQGGQRTGAARPGQAEAQEPDVCTGASGGGMAAAQWVRDMRIGFYRG